MQQPPAHMLNMGPSFPSANITTEQIQKLLDENKRLILAILENQNLGRIAECAQYQAQLQKNLMYLAAIADNQQPATTTTTTIPPQMPLHSAVQQGNYMQHSQAAMAQQQGIFDPKSQFQFNDRQQQQHQHQQQQTHLQQQQHFLGHMGMRPSATNGMHQIMQSGLAGSSNSVDAQGSRKDGSDAPSGDVLRK